MIKFSCPQCASRFSVNEKLAGRVGRCKTCSHQLKIPVSQEAGADVAVSGRFRLANVDGGGPAQAASEDARKIASSSADRGQKPAHQNYETLGLLATTNSSLQPIQQAEYGLDDSISGDSGDYKLAPIDEDRRIFNQMLNQHKCRQAFSATKLYGKTIGNTLGFLEGLSQFAFVVTWFFGMMVLFGAAAGQRGWAVTGATVIVLLAIAQIALNFFYLVLMPFNGSPKKALQFFLPPYKKNQRRQVTRALMRLMTPAIPVVCLVVLFAFVPVLNRGNVPRDASLKQQIGAEAGALKQEIRGTISQGVGAVGQNVENAAGNLPSIDLQELQNRGQQEIERLNRADQ